MKTALAVGIALGTMASAQAPASAGIWAGGHGWASENVLLGDGFYGHRPGLEAFGDAVGFWKSILYSHYGPDWIQPGPVWYGGAETWWTAQWQRDHGITADGIVGPETWAAARWWHVRLFDVVGDWEVYSYTVGCVNGKVRWHTYFIVHYLPYDGWGVIPNGYGRGANDEFLPSGAVTTISHDTSQFVWVERTWEWPHTGYPEQSC